PREEQSGAVAKPRRAGARKVRSWARAAPPRQPSGPRGSETRGRGAVRLLDRDSRQARTANFTGPVSLSSRFAPCRQSRRKARRKSTREDSLRARRTRRAEVLACSAADLPSVGAGRISTAGGVAKAALVTRGRFVAYADRDTGAGIAIVTNASRSLTDMVRRFAP